MCYKAITHMFHPYTALSSVCVCAPVCVCACVCVDAVLVFQTATASKVCHEVLEWPGVVIFHAELSVCPIASSPVGEGGNSFIWHDCPRWVCNGPRREQTLSVSETPPKL